MNLSGKPTYFDTINKNFNSTSIAEQRECVRVAVEHVVQKLHRLRDKKQAIGEPVLNSLNQDRDHACTDDHVASRRMSREEGDKGEEHFNERLRQS